MIFLLSFLLAAAALSSLSPCCHWCGRVRDGSCRRCGVHCSCASVAKCSLARLRMHARMPPRPPPAVILVRLLVVISFSFCALSVLLVCLFCKMLIGTSPPAFEKIPRPPPTVSLG